VLDFAGGSVVHINAGVSGLVCAYLLGPRQNYGKEAFEPINLGLTMAGAGLLWVGWFGFNAGSAVAADGRGHREARVVQRMDLNLVDLLGRGPVLVALNAFLAFGERDRRTRRHLREASLHQGHRLGGAHPREGAQSLKLGRIGFDHERTEPAAAPYHRRHPSHRTYRFGLKGKVGAAKTNSLGSAARQRVRTQHGLRELNLRLAQENPVLARGILGPN
jgi:hypothetical protein